MNLRFAFAQDTLANKQDHAELWDCVCQALDGALNGRRLEELSRSVLEAIVAPSL